MDTPSRFESIRRKLRLTRYAVVAASSVAFVGGTFVARAAHAGAATPSSSTSQAQQPQSTATEQDSFDYYGDSSITPSYGAAPQVQSGGS